MSRTPHARTLTVAASCLLALACTDDGKADADGPDDELGSDSSDSSDSSDTADSSDSSSGSSDSGSSDSDSGSSSSGSSSESESETTGGQLPPCAGYFPADAVWCQDVTAATTHPDSQTIVTWLEQAGWGNNDNFQIDFSIEVLEADADTPRRAFEATGSFYTPDCDWVEVPVPAGGAIEGERGYECVGDGDCHLIVAARDENLLYEMWRANIDADDTFYGGCLAVWDMTQVYDDEGRGQGCTSADAAGFPIAPLLFDADEVAAGSIDHAIRFILPNANIRNLIYSPPATHSTGATSGPIEAPPYGVHLRLRPDFPMDSLPSEGAKVVAQALQTYGMFLADGGQIALTGQSDRFTANKWADLLAPQDLVSLRPMDFEVIDHGALLDWGEQSCEREPLGTPP